MYANTFCESGFLFIYKYSAAFISADSPLVAMLNGREKLRKEYQAKSYVTSGLGSYNRTNLDHAFRVSKKEPDGEIEVVEGQQGVWMNTIKRRGSVDATGIAQIQVDKVVVSHV